MWVVGNFKELIASYSILEGVQELGAIEHWKIDTSSGYLLLYYYAESIKWYDSDPYVQSVKSLLELSRHMCEQRNLPGAYSILRVGEEWKDIEDDVEYFNPENEFARGRSVEIYYDLLDRHNLTRKIDHKLDGVSLASNKEKENGL
jgi:hypothetical protein